MRSPDDSEALPSRPITPEESYYLEFATKEPVDSLARLMRSRNSSLGPARRPPACL
jgi:hypothetical protein